MTTNMPAMSRPQVRAVRARLSNPLSALSPVAWNECRQEQKFRARNADALAIVVQRHGVRVGPKAGRTV